MAGDVPGVPRVSNLRLLFSRILSWFPRSVRNGLRSLLVRAKRRWVQEFRSYGMVELARCIRSLGIRPGDTVMLHSAFNHLNGFRGTPGEVADAFLEVLGESGNLMMVSLPTTGASHEYLSRISVFDVRKAPSRMGLVSEFFRRREGVRRSLHPSHPMLAYGPRADWILKGHAECLYPCGPGSPFDKAVELDGKVVFFDTGLNKMTFFHWLEHRVQDHVDIPLYQDAPYAIPVIDQKGEERVVRTFAFSQEAIEARRDWILHREMLSMGIVRSARVGNTRIMAVELRDVVRCIDSMTDRGIFFYAGLEGGSD